MVRSSRFLTFFQTVATMFGLETIEEIKSLWRTFITHATRMNFGIFTFDEMAKIDLPTQIDFVLNKTGAKTLSYIGHSEGTTQAFIGFGLNVTTAAKVNVFIALAPVTHVFYTESLVLRALADLYLDEIFYLLGVQAFELSDAVQALFSEECTKDPTICYASLELLFGPSTHINKTALGEDTMYFPAATSVKNMAHWGQWVRNDKFDMFNYGETGNQEHYGQKDPPLYNISAIPLSLPIALFTGGNDYLADPRDVANLQSDLKNYQPAVFDIVDYAHMDPVLAFDAYQLDYPTLFDILAKHAVPPK